VKTVSDNETTAREAARVAVFVDEDCVDSRSRVDDLRTRDCSCL